ncbi:hypothetical protein AB0J38_13380 [Streptomyces sp. NPDC050095]
MTVSTSAYPRSASHIVHTRRFMTLPLLGDPDAPEPDEDEEVLD